MRPILRFLGPGALLLLAAGPSREPLPPGLPAWGRTPSLRDAGAAGTWRPLSPKDLDRALEVCYALAGKEVRLRARAVGEGFLFRVGTTDCLGGRASFLAPAVLEEPDGPDGAMEYVPAEGGAGLPLGTVQTHRHGLLGRFCREALGGPWEGDAGPGEDAVVVGAPAPETAGAEEGALDLLVFRAGSAVPWRRVRLLVALGTGPRRGSVLRAALKEGCLSRVQELILE